MHPTQKTILPDKIAESSTVIASRLEAFEEKKAKLSKLANTYAGLTIQGIEDKEGFKRLSDARKELKKHRLEISNQGKEIISSWNIVKNEISSKQEELINIIKPIEDKLYQKEQEIEKENEKIKLEQKLAEDKKVQAKVDAFAKVGAQISFIECKFMSDTEFERLLAAHTEKFTKDEAEKAEQERIKLEQEKEKAAELERLKIKLAEVEKNEFELQKKLEQSQNKAAQKSTTILDKQPPPGLTSQNTIEEKLIELTIKLPVDVYNGLTINAQKKNKTITEFIESALIKSIRK